MAATDTAERPRRTEAGTIDLTPTWVAIMPALIAALQDGTPRGQQIAKEELMRLARIADNAGRPLETGVPD